MKIKRKLRTIIGILINIFVLTIMIIVLSIYTSKNQKEDKEWRNITIQQTTESVTDAVRLYFEQQQLNLVNKKNYIHSKNFSLEETIKFLFEANSNQYFSYQLVNPQNSTAYSIDNQGNITIIEYTESYEAIQNLISIANQNLIDDSLINISSSFTNPVNSSQSVAFFSNLYPFKNDENNFWILLEVIQTKYLLGSGLPTLPYVRAGSAIVIKDGSYIVKTNEFKSENVYEFFRAYNNLSYPQAEEIKNNVNNSISGFFSYKNSKEQLCMFSYNQIAKTAGWFYFSLIPESSLKKVTIDWYFIGIFMSFLCILIAYDLSIILRLNQKLKLSLIETKAANVAKTTFLSNMSHEIRTPLNAIIGYNKIAQRAIKTIFTESSNSNTKIDKINDCLQKSEIASKQLLSLINNILDMSSIENGKTKIANEIFNFEELIKEISTVYSSIAQEKNISFDINKDNVTKYSLYGDSVRLSQVIINLVGNALKFTPKNGFVTLTFKQNIISETDLKLFIIVADTGIGMNQDFLANIWTAFEQENNKILKEYGGSGLGLFISKSIVELMGGQISVESQLKKGSTFTVELPVKYSKEIIKTNNQNIKTYSFVGKKVLLVEDNKMNMEISTSILTETGLEITKAWNGQEAVEKFVQSKVGDFNLIIMDVQMPKMNGHEATKQIRALNRPDAMSIPIIAMTADAFSENIKEAHKSGMNAHISKPIDINQLYKTLQKFL